jgi:hypothetical protein
MRNPTRYAITIFAALMLLCSSASGQNNYKPAGVGYVNFNLGKPLLQPTHQQTVSLYGCNTRITIDGKHWYDSDSLRWGISNQILDSVPFGPQIDPVTGDSFYISKYYIAAPPVIQKDKKQAYKTQFNIGKVIPDCFAFDGNNPMQLVYFDYSRFQLMQVKFVPVEFDSSFNKAGIGILPINIDCKDFPWKPVDELTNITGASGIGDLQPSKSGNFSGLFLPYYYTNKMQTDSTFLHCEITILNDIVPYYECYFDVDGEPFTTIDLGAVKDKKIVIKAIPRLGNPMPCGCRKPE